MGDVRHGIRRARKRAGTEFRFEAVLREWKFCSCDPTAVRTLAQPVPPYSDSILMVWWAADICCTSAEEAVQRLKCENGCKAFLQEGTFGRSCCATAPSVAFHSHTFQQPFALKIAVRVCI
jgi:hypothetical protein